METRANYATIAVFVLAVCAAAFAFVWWFSAGAGGPQRQAVRVAFEGSVAGLVKGADVVFNGIRVGEVMRVYFDPVRPEQAYAEIMVDRAAPLRSDTQARLETTILSGSGRIALSGGAANAPALAPGEDGSPPVLVAQKSGIASIAEQVTATAAKAEALREQVNGILAENRATLEATFENIGKLTSALNRNEPATSRAIASIRDAGGRIGELGAKLEPLGERVSAIRAAVDTRSTGIIRENAAILSEVVEANRPRIDEIRASVAALSPRIATLAPKAEQVAAPLGPLGAAVDPAKIQRATDNLDRIRAVFDTTSADRDAISRHVEAIQDKFGRSAARIAAIREAAARFVDSKAGPSAFTAVGEAVASIRRTTNNLDRRSAEITAALARVQSVAAREVKTLRTESRRALDEVARTGRNLSANPQSVIFGGPASTLPTYNGR